MYHFAFTLAIQNRVHVISNNFMIKPSNDFVHFSTLSLSLSIRTLLSHIYIGKVEKYIFLGLLAKWVHRISLHLPT